MSSVCLNYTKWEKELKTIIIIIIMNDNLYSAECTTALQGRLASHLDKTMAWPAI